MPVYSLGISPCPNDTYIFDALVNARIPLPFAPNLHMADVEELNRLARTGALAATKLSIGAALTVLDTYVMLNSGAALGRGCGPLLVCRKGFPEERREKASIAIPGPMTTANLLLSLNGEFKGARTPMVFDQVMPAVLAGRADLGVIIHEGRFTYAQKGLELVLDLGSWWERYSGMPLPLGIIAVRRDLGAATALAFEDAIRRSIEHANAHPDDCRDFVRSHAQEMDPQVMRSHIATFVNEFSLDLGQEGRMAVSALFKAGAESAGISLPGLPFFAGF